MDKIVKDFNSIILKKRSIVFGVVAALLAVYACSSSYDCMDDELAEKASVLMPGDRVEGTRNVNGKTIHTAIGGTVADYVDLGIMVDGKKVRVMNNGMIDIAKYIGNELKAELGIKEKVHGVVMKGLAERFEGDPEGLKKAILNSIDILIPKHIRKLGLRMAYAYKERDARASDGRES